MWGMGIGVGQKVSDEERLSRGKGQEMERARVSRRYKRRAQVSMKITMMAWLEW